MIEKGKISPGQLAFSLYSLMAYDGLLLIPKIAGENAGRDLWLSPVWSHLAGIITIAQRSHRSVHMVCRVYFARAVLPVIVR
ncbi:hypothetical protein C7820_4212 [Paenibacillus sp. VMFN-D1]|nr:hypothetical protein C7820_4212 [Paenibacillus sp. VMFN-D1]